MPKGVIDLLACGQGRFGLHQNIEIWKANTHCLMWCIWQERNSRSFEGCERTILDPKLMFF